MTQPVSAGMAGTNQTTLALTGPAALWTVLTQGNIITRPTATISPATCDTDPVIDSAEQDHMMAPNQPEMDGTFLPQSHLHPIPHHPAGTW